MRLATRAERAARRQVVQVAAVLDFHRGGRCVIPGGADARPALAPDERFGHLVRRRDGVAMPPPCSSLRSPSKMGRVGGCHGVAGPPGDRPPSGIPAEVSAACRRRTSKRVTRPRRIRRGLLRPCPCRDGRNNRRCSYRGLYHNCRTRPRTSVCSTA